MDALVGIRRLLDDWLRLADDVDGHSAPRVVSHRRSRCPLPWYLALGD